MLPQTPEDVSTILAAAKNFVDGFTSGLSPTSGAWFDTEPGDSPYSYAPKSERRSTASGLLGRPTDWWFSGATADSRGAPRNVTDDDWSLIGGGGPDGRRLDGQDPLPRPRSSRGVPVDKGQLGM